MKINKTLLLGAAVAAALAANQTLRADFSPSDLSNKAVASSPRAREQFPWLAWQGWTRSARAEGIPDAVRRNSALAASPRMRELYPELARGGQNSTIAPERSGKGDSQLAVVTSNQALAHSPRMLEQFPELKLRYLDGTTGPTFEVAPIK